MNLLPQALWSQRNALVEYAPRLYELRKLVNSPNDLSIAQWAHLFALVQEFKPDLIVELGRGFGNSTCLFTDCANSLQGCKVVSVGYDNENAWKTVTVPKLHKIVGPEWFVPLNAVHSDIMAYNFEPYIAAAKRVLFFWDAHGDILALHILHSLLPLVEKRENVVVVHDISDARYCYSSRSYIRDDGLPQYYAGDFVCPFEEIYPLYDFLTRNRIKFHSADYDIFNDLISEPGMGNQLMPLWREAYPKETPLGNGHMLYFGLNERADTIPIEYPPAPRMSVSDAPNAQPAPVIPSSPSWVAEKRPEDFRIRELIRAVLVRLGRKFGLE